MTNKFNHYIGIDVSKETLDICVLEGTNKVFESRIANSKPGLKMFVQKLKQHQISPSSALFCLEHTGIYNYQLVDWSVKHNYQIWLENPNAIKRSMGLQRGKNDRIDAYRIAVYAFRFQDQCRLWEAPREEVKQLRELLALRKRIVSVHKQLSVPLEESKDRCPKKHRKMILNNCSDLLSEAKKSLRKVDKEIKDLITRDEKLSALTEIISSVDGIGMVVASYLVAITNEFLTLNKGAQLACYAGVVPFGYSSGSSIRGRNKVSNMANKTLKSLLHMAALSAIKNSEELSTYYKRKVAEGKPKMSVINAIRNKLVLRICACVRESRKYEKKYA